MNVSAQNMSTGEPLRLILNCARRSRRHSNLKTRRE